MSNDSVLNDDFSLHWFSFDLYSALSSFFIAFSAIPIVKNSEKQSKDSQNSKNEGLS